MRTYLQIIICLQMLVIVGAVLAAVVEIESILATGPILSFIGLLIAHGCFRRRLPLGFYFGLSVPTISVLCFFIIFGLQWGPGRAATPIAALLALFAIVALPTGAWAVREVRNAKTLECRPRLQIDAGVWIVLMALVAVNLFLILTRSALAEATGVLYAYGIACGYLLRCFHRHDGWHVTSEAAKKRPPLKHWQAPTLSDSSAIK